jgi:hypothetical protein
MSKLVNYYPDLIQRKIGVPESFESKCTLNVRVQPIKALAFIQSKMFIAIKMSYYSVMGQK